MKKVCCFIIMIFFFKIGIASTTYALSNEFLFLLETMDIDIINPDGLKINEDIYNEYKLIVYGSPHDYYKEQRWKNVDNGHWSKNVGPWNGQGIRGEYWILGVNYYGKQVHNHLFPVDIEPPTPPTQWRYAVIPDALESWQDVEKYMDDIQKEYMLTQNLTRNNITYDLKISDIGFNKVRLENYATWKTQGSVYTQRYDMNNKKWAANFLIPPMAANAEVESYAEFSDGMEYSVLNENELNIPITYGAKVINLTNYANKQHVKQIKSELYINNIFIDICEDSEELQIKKDFNYKVNKENFSGQSFTILNIQIRSTLLTKFTTDGVLTDIKNYTIFIYWDMEEEKNESNNIYVMDEDYIRYPEIPAPKITSIEISRIVDGKEKQLLIARKTGEKFICAGQTITLKIKAINLPEKVTIEFEGDSSIVTLDSLTEKFEWIEPRRRNKKTIVSSFEKLKQMYKGKISAEKIGTENEESIFLCTYVVPYQTRQTLHSWSTLREITKDAFQINENKLFSRIQDPYELVVKASGPTGKTTVRLKLDVFERWDTLYNRNLKNYTINN